MGMFAVIEDNVVINTILADSKSIAEEVTNKTCIEYTQDNPLGIGFIYDGEKFINPTMKPSYRPEIIE